MLPIKSFLCRYLNEVYYNYNEKVLIINKYILICVFYLFIAKKFYYLIKFQDAKFILLNIKRSTWTVMLFNIA